jgi:multiple sugar transport system ATP-binding protein
VAGFIGSPAMNFFPVTAETGGEGTFLVGDGFRLQVPKAYEAAIGAQARSGGQLMMGLRPEDIADPAFVHDPNPANMVQAMVDVVEPLGAEVYLACVVGQTQFTARVDPRTQAKAGEPATLYFEAEKMHVFNPTTQEALL